MAKTCAFGEWIKKIGKSKGLSGNNISVICDISRKTLSDYVTGKAKPSILNVIRLKEGLGLRDEDILDMIDAIAADFYDEGKLDLLLDED